MKHIKTYLFAAIGALTLNCANAIEFTGMATVNITSDTAATAKNMAFDEARRQIITDTVRQYADADALSELIKTAKSSELTDLISSSSIDGEKLSDTTYSANITMVVNGDAVQQWLGDKGIQNWIPNDTNPDMFIVTVNMPNPMANWIELNEIARSEKIDLNTVAMTSNSAVLRMPVSTRGKFTIAAREYGWKYSDMDGNLRIWK